MLLGPDVIISGAVGRTELRASPGGAATAFAAGGLAAGAAAVGGPIEIAGIAGRLAADAGRPPESPRADAAGAVAPTSMGRVTTTAGDAAAGACAGAAPAATLGPDAGGAATGATFDEPDDGCAFDVPLFDCGVCAAGIPRCVGFADDAVPFCGWALGCCAAPAPRPSFGGRCIDGPSSAAGVGAASVSPLGLPEKSLEKTLIAEHQR